MVKRALNSDPHIFRWGGPEEDGAPTCRDCHQTLSTSWLHTDQALKLMERLRAAEAAVAANQISPFEQAVRDEREAQDVKWGEQNYPDGTGRAGDTHFAAAFKEICKANGPGQDNFRDILAEEVFEAFAETDPAPLRAELIQVAAVALAWAEAIDRREGSRS